MTGFVVITLTPVIEDFHFSFRKTFTTTIATLADNTPFCTHTVTFIT